MSGIKQIDFKEDIIVNNIAFEMASNFIPFIHKDDCTVCKGYAVEDAKEDHFYHHPTDQFSVLDSKRIQRESERRYAELKEK